MSLIYGNKVVDLHNLRKPVVDVPYLGKGRVKDVLN